MSVATIAPDELDDPPQHAQPHRGRRGHQVRVGSTPVLPERVPQLPAGAGRRPARRTAPRRPARRLPTPAPARATPLPGAARVERSVRLTGRGRLLVLGMAMLVLLDVGMLAHAQAASRPVPAGATGRSVVVQPGESLWQVAARAEPQADPRAAVADLQRVNHLSDTVVHPGQRLVLPTR